MADLVFKRPRYTGGPVDLVFGDTGGESPALPSRAYGTSGLGGPGGVGLARYDNKNPRRVSTTAATGWQQAAPTPKDTESGWGNTARRLDGVDVAWAKAAVARLETDTAWGISGKVEHANRSGWEAGRPVQAQFDAVHQTATRLLQQCLSGWQVAVPVQITVGSDWQTGRPAMAQLVVDMADALRLQALGVMPWQVAGKADRVHLAPWQVARPVPPGKEVWPPPGPGEPVAPRVPSTHLVFKCPPWMGGPVNLVFGRVCGPDEPEPPGQIIVPVRGVYMTINTVLLRRVAGSQTMPAIGFRMALDVDSFTWSWSATCAGSAMSLLDPGSGDPVEMEVQINGVAYRLYAENVNRTRRFGETVVEVSGRGLAAALDSPYAPTMNFSAATSLTALQLAGQALTINGEGIGWTINWMLDDWLVPGGVWAHQGTHISAVNAIARAGGGYVQPHATSKVLRVLPRYPAAPWDWEDLTPDIELPADPVVVEGIRWIHKPAYNRVFVRGEGQGVLGQVTRLGSAGDVVAPMVVDPLITHVDAARQRGLQVLADTGSQAEVALSLPVLPETGLILPGKLVRYVEGGTPRLGLVRSTSVEWQRPKLRQTISLETHI